MELFIIMATIAFVCRDPAGTLKEAANYRRAQADRDKLRGRGRSGRRRPGSGAMRRYLGTVWEDQWERAIERYPERMKAAQSRRTKRRAKRAATWEKVQDTAGKRWDRRMGLEDFEGREEEPEIDPVEGEFPWQTRRRREEEARREKDDTPVSEEQPVPEDEDPQARMERLDREHQEWIERVERASRTLKEREAAEEARQAEREAWKRDLDEVQQELRRQEREHDLRERERELREREEAEILRRREELLQDQAKEPEPAQDPEPAPAEEPEPAPDPEPAPVDFWGRPVPYPSAWELHEWRLRDAIHEYGRGRPWEPPHPIEEKAALSSVVDLDQERRKRQPETTEPAPSPVTEEKETPMLNLSDAASLGAHLASLREYGTYWDSTCTAKEQLAAGMTAADMGETTVAAVDASRAAYAHAAAQARAAADALEAANTRVAEARAGSPDAAHGEYLQRR
ncbi:hypothetical protein [Nocardiopsis sp. L17-MgMaSL7]|uniref:hypothetical protein n=1 Tax=Nocardiopsis sp. L17-MgMaSL7 TaxID=1938893 RepID=UPI000D719381|nr:hypothetical protein [Nocardiopsis sp. L17-MgMaSL7]PWV44561.1 hypothetical protein BDW27_12320 [Nocardiopsis sp. L17-MgMaSL7]